MPLPLKALFLVDGDEGEGESPSATYRVWQLRRHLADHGIMATVRAARPNKYRNGPPSWPRVARAVTFPFWQTVKAARRIGDLSDLASYDAVILQRELFSIGPPILELAIVRRHPAVIFDFDDAIYLPAHFPHRFVTPRDKIPKIVRAVREVWCGSEYLADWARSLSKSVAVIPTPVDTGRYFPSPATNNAVPVIGWVGQPGNYHEVERIAPVLSKLAAAMKFKLRIVTRGIPGALPPGSECEILEWSYADDPGMVRTFDIGIMPLADTPWNRGKCAFKALTYMASGVPVVLSPVGANKEVVEEGATGFFAASDSEWSEKLERLLKDAALRCRMGMTARDHIEKNYSASVVARKMAERIRALTIKR